MGDDRDRVLHDREIKMKLPCRFRNRFYSCVSPAPNHVFFLVSKSVCVFHFSRGLDFGWRYFIGKIIGKIIGHIVGHLIVRIVGRIIGSISAAESAAFSLRNRFRYWSGHFIRRIIGYWQYASWLTSWSDVSLIIIIVTDYWDQWICNICLIHCRHGFRMCVWHWNQSNYESLNLMQSLHICPVSRSNSKPNHD